MLGEKGWKENASPATYEQVHLSLLTGLLGYVAKKEEDEKSQDRNSKTGGFDAAREFIVRTFAADFCGLDLPTGIENPKGELQELLQSKSPVAPQYQLIAADGPDHDRRFECAVLHEGVELARGVGKSKKAAESDAALAALKKLRSQLTS